MLERIPEAGLGPKERPAHLAAFAFQTEWRRVRGLGSMSRRFSLSARAYAFATGLAQRVPAWTSSIRVTRARSSRAAGPCALRLYKRSPPNLRDTTMPVLHQEPNTTRMDWSVALTMRRKSVALISPSLAIHTIERVRPDVPKKFPENAIPALPSDVARSSLQVARNKYALTVIFLM